MSDTDSPAFLALVLPWLQQEGRHPEAVAIVNVYAAGSGWAGSTAHGFHADITWRDAAGKQRDYSADGEEMGSLWDWVVGARASQAGTPSGSHSLETGMSGSYAIEAAQQGRVTWLTRDGIRLAAIVPPGMATGWQCEVTAGQLE
jgi:hypothetical protein